jgi:hypothetical protein
MEFNKIGISIITLEKSRKRKEFNISLFMVNMVIVVIK